MIEEGEVYYIEMELMAGVEVGADELDVDGEHGHATMDVSTSTKSPTRPAAMKEKEKTSTTTKMNEGEALLTSLQDWKGNRGTFQQNSVQHFLRQ